MANSSRDLWRTLNLVAIGLSTARVVALVGPDGDATWARCATAFPSGRHRGVGG